MGVAFLLFRGVVVRRGRVRLVAGSGQFFASDNHGADHGGVFSNVAAEGVRGPASNCLDEVERYAILGESCHSS